MSSKILASCLMGVVFGLILSKAWAGIGPIYTSVPYVEMLDVSRWLDLSKQQKKQLLKA